jgi:MoCo/4Fe-4S cofactor protein with predicted Tat translocation signal
MTARATTTSSDFLWRNLENLESSPELNRELATKMPAGVIELETSGVDRRRFLEIMGASMALAGVGVAGCVRKPKEKIVEFSRRPEDLVPGNPRYYATATHVGPWVLGLLVESQEGRPTKIEGNPRHPMSMGATSAWAQGTVLGLYDPDRSRMVVKGGRVAELNWREQLRGELATTLGSAYHSAKRDGGKGFAFVVEYRPSPTLWRLIAKLRAELPQAGLYIHDPLAPTNTVAGSVLATGAAALPVVAYDQARVVLAIDADFMGVDGDSVRNARLFARGRKVEKSGDAMNRLYVAEPALTITGSVADHRAPSPASEVAGLLLAIAGDLAQKGLPGGDALRSVFNQKGRAAREQHGAFVSGAADDLWQARGASAVVVGERQPAWVHALAAWVNDALGNTATVRYVTTDVPAAGNLTELTARIRAKEIQTLVISGCNPVYDAPADLDFAGALASVPLSVHHSTHIDETSLLCTWHTPRSHYLEAWGDLRASDGTASVQQPLIEPLYGTLSEIELIATMTGQPRSGYELVRETWATESQNDKAWRTVLHSGVVGEPKATIATVSGDKLASALEAANVTRGEGLELDFALDAKILDGRFANNGWLQELPDPVTKLTWDNAALIGPTTAKELGIENGAVVAIEVGSARLTIPAWVTPGVTKNTVILPLGYGRRNAGKVGDGVGENVAVVRASSSPYVTSGAKLALTGQVVKLACTQDYGQLVEPFTGKTRNIFREATLADFVKQPDFVLGQEVMAPEKIVSAFAEPHEYQKGEKASTQQWGMSIDLNACTGCNACVIACQAENNIPVVGKERVRMGREMHWIRMDRYFSGDPEAPRVHMQPLPCQHCENAPCETVCPVNATAHSPDGMNDMAYNRCIGTRYCANNCPYKVRRFNFFNFSKENDADSPLLAMQRNPDVTVRFRGVMEKCTFCVQRVNQAKISAKRDGDGRVKEGAVVTACQQVCPTEAIVFGDITDPASAVSKAKAQPRMYKLLGELNTKPRTTYLAKLRNPNPDVG